MHALLYKIPSLQLVHWPVEEFKFDQIVHLLFDFIVVPWEQVVHIDKTLLESYWHAVQLGIAAVHWAEVGAVSFHPVTAVPKFQ